MARLQDCDSRRWRPIGLSRIGGSAFAYLAGSRDKVPPYPWGSVRSMYCMIRMIRTDQATSSQCAIPYGGWIVIAQPKAQSPTVSLLCLVLSVLGVWDNQTATFLRRSVSFVNREGVLTEHSFTEQDEQYAPNGGGSNTLARGDEAA